MLDGMLSASADPIYLSDKEGRLLYQNEASARAMGNKQSDPIGKTMRELGMPADIVKQSEAQLNNVLASGQAQAGTVDYPSPDGVRNYEFVMSPVFDPDGDVEGVVVSSRDVTEHKRMLEAIAENEARFRSVVETATDAIITTNANGDIVFWNPAAEKMFGYTAEEAHGKPLGSLAPKPMQKFAIGEIARFLRDPTSHREIEESQAQRKDGSLFETETSLAPWTIDSEQFTTAVVRDISDRKRTQERLASFNECLLKFGSDPISNISSLTALCGDLLEASSAFYVHFGEQNEAWGRWNAPEGWGLGEVSDGQLLFESAQRSALEPAVIQDLSRSAFAQTDPSVQRYNWQTYIGTLAIAAAEPVGTFALIFTDDRSPSTEDLRIVQLTVSAIGVEESRWTAQQEIKQREAQQKAIFESVQTGIALIDPTTHKIVDVNTTAAHLFGASKEAIIGSVCHRFICPADVGRCPITDLGQTVDNAERVLLTADGKSCPILKSVSKITLGGHAYLLESFIDISDRKQIERALLESEAYYRAIFESTATGMAIVEEDMTVVMVNSILEQLTGFSKNEVEGLKPWTDFVAPEDLELMKTYHRARRRDEGSAPKGYEFRLLTKDGTRREAFLTVALIPGTQRSVVSIVDLTALKTAQEVAQKQATMLDAARDCIVIFDDVGTLTYWNRGAERLYGWTKQEAEGQNVHALLQTTFPESLEALWSKLLKHSAWEGELIHVARDGRPVTVASSWTLLKNEKGNTYDILEICSDITERKQADDALNESERHIRELTNALPVVVFETDTTGVVKFINTAAFETLGYSKEELEAGMSLFQVIAPADRERIGTILSERASWEDLWVELTALRKDGSTFPLSVRGVPIMRDGAVVGIRGIAVDITERKRAEQTLASELAINSTIARLSAPLIAPTSSIEDIALAILNEAKGLTGSEAGFVGLIDLANRDMIAFGLTQMMVEGCAIPEEQQRIRFPIGPDGSYSALWGHALNAKKGFYTNAPATHPASRGTPDGHAPLAQLLAAPALVGEDVVGQVAVANPGRDYTERDLRAVERLADVYALATVRTRAEDALKQARDDMQALNEALRSANEELRSDIAERKKAELALADSEAKLRITFTAMVDGVVTGGLDWKVTYCNEGLLRITQRSKEEVIGKPFVDLLTPDGRSQILETIPELMEKGNIRTVDKMLRKNGGSVDVEANVSLITDAAGQPTAFLAVIRDITERQKAELALAESEAKLSITFATMADGIVLNGLDRKVTDCNEAVLRLTQRSREEIIGKPFTDLLAPEFRSQILETIPELLERRNHPYQLENAQEKWRKC